MKTCVITCGRLENRYAIEWVEYYKQLGFDHIFIADNNRNNEEHFEDVLQTYIDNNFITIYNYRDQDYGQLHSYINIYYDISNDYDWALFCDFDEFLVLQKDCNIQDYLSRECFKDKNQILINWQIYTDNDLVEDDGRGCLERFTTPMEINKYIEYTWMPENAQVKPLLRTNIKNIVYTSPHFLTDEDHLLEKTTCNNCGNLCKEVIAWQWDDDSTQEINYELSYLKHFTTKTIDEWINNKAIRGTGDRNKEWFDLTYPLVRFFKYNNITEEKLNYLKKHNIDISNINKENCEAWLVEGFIQNKDE